MTSTGRTAWRASLAISLFVSTTPAASYAQAWLPPKGEGSLSIGVQSLHAGRHIEADGTKDSPVDLRMVNLILDVTYGLTSRVALDFGMPYIASRFRPVDPCLDPTGCADAENPATDNGRYYKTFQDFRLNVRYATLSRPFALTPSLEVVLPSHVYETEGHAAAGRDLRELGLGLHAGRALDPVSSNTYVHASYVFTLSQHLVHEGLDIGMNRSNAAFEVGHLLTRAVTVRGFGSWEATHGGLAWTNDLFDPASPLSMHEHIHDQAAKASYWHVGAGGAYSVNDSLSVNLSMLRTLSGRNTHEVGGFTLAATWTFGHGGAGIGALSNRLDQVALGAGRR
jgi:hypothetical protein